MSWGDQYNTAKVEITGSDIARIAHQNNQHIRADVHLSAFLTRYKDEITQAAKAAAEAKVKEILNIPSVIEVFQITPMESKTVADCLKGAADKLYREELTVEGYSKG